ncbi:hypothetical protein RB653_000202 [Dictyostelium firmibasis]|uniref:Transmembrane protein n=1 Tax=Dictyostelium firmibasis TaxID=79012 RepID=A0AAN7YQI0_9MYCE
MSIIKKDTIYTSLKIVYSVCLASSPIWGTGVLLATLMMNDSGRFKERFQMGCLYSFLATPIALTYTIFRIQKGDRRPLIALLPLIPVGSYIACFFAFWKDEKKQ